MKINVKSFVCGALFVWILTASTADANYYSLHSVANALWSISGHAASSAKAEWQQVYWLKKMATQK